MPDFRTKLAAATLLLLCRIPAWATTPGVSEAQSGAFGLWRLSFVAVGALAILFFAIPSCLHARKTLRRIGAQGQEGEEYRSTPV